VHRFKTAVVYLAPVGYWHKEILLQPGDGAEPCEETALR
jgi:hypothetical protein